MDTDLQKKLSDLDKGQLEIIRQFHDLSELLKDAVVEIGGVPDDIGRDPNRKSLRRRVHDLENDREAVRIAGDAVQAAVQARDQAIEARNERDTAKAMNQFTRREKIAGLLLTVAVVAGPYVSAAFFGH